MQKVSTEQYVTDKTWEEFRSTGLLLFINQILHVFGWAIVMQINGKNEITKCYPARVKFRGFGNDSVQREYMKITQYLKENADQLLKEAQE